MTLANDRIDRYCSDGSQSVQGWCYPLDMFLLRVLDFIQKQTNCQGDLCEVGVYHGKSLILLNLLSRSHETVFAFDLFPDDMLAVAQENLATYANAPGIGAVRFLPGDSSELSSAGLADTLRQPLRLLHIDAGHEYHEVLHQLYVFAPFVSNHGVIVIDDYQDREYPGIEAAVYEFVRQQSPRRFVPFLAGGNKLFLCHPNEAALYQAAAIEHQQMRDTCRITRIDDSFVLIAASREPMTNVQVKAVLEANWTPAEYAVDMIALGMNAKRFGARQQ